MKIQELENKIKKLEFKDNKYSEPIMDKINEIIEKVEQEPTCMCPGGERPTHRCQPKGSNPSEMSTKTKDSLHSEKDVNKTEGKCSNPKCILSRHQQFDCVETEGRELIKHTNGEQHPSDLYCDWCRTIKIKPTIEWTGTPIDYGAKTEDGEVEYPEPLQNKCKCVCMEYCVKDCPVCSPTTKGQECRWRFELFRNFYIDSCGTSHDWVGDFIRSLLAQQKKELIEKIESLRHIETEKHDNQSKLMSIGFNSALDDILKEI